MNEWLIRLLIQMVLVMSPQLKDLLTTQIRELEAQAHATQNPWDDLFISLLKVVLGINQNAQ